MEMAVTKRLRFIDAPFPLRTCDGLEPSPTAVEMEKAGAVEIVAVLPPGTYTLHTATGGNVTLVRSIQATSDDAQMEDPQRRVTATDRALKRIRDNANRLQSINQRNADFWAKQQDRR
jgi:hypothetical protein